MRISYTAKIKLTKAILLSIIAIVILCFLIAPTVYIKIRTSGYLFAASMLSGLLKKNITPPVVSGTTKQGGAYYLSAEKVTNNLFDINNKEGGVIAVTKPTLLYTTNKNNLVFTIRSLEATIDIATRIIKIPGIVNILSNQKYSAALSGITIDIKNDSAVTNNPVTGKFENRVLTTNGITAQNGGDIVIFKGPVAITTVLKDKKQNNTQNKTSNKNTKSLY